MSGANGDTAKPAPRYSDDHYQKAETRKKQRRLMYVWGLDGTCIFDGDGYSEFAPYGRVIRDGCVIRIETDGNGGLVEYVESRPATLSESVENRPACRGPPSATRTDDDLPSLQTSSRSAPLKLTGSQGLSITPSTYMLS